jgi:hypothetical protein
MSKRTAAAETSVSLLMARELAVDEAIAELRAYRIYRQSRDVAWWDERHALDLEADR